MKRSTRRRSTAKGALAGLIGGLAASWAANQFHSLWSHLQEGDENAEMNRLSQRGGRPDTAAAKEQAGSGVDPEEDATVTVARQLSRPFRDAPLDREEEHRGGVMVHYLFGAAGGAAYGAMAEATPAITAGRGTVFGVAVWLGAVEVALPVLKLARPPWKYPLRMHVYSFLSHLVYGAVTEGVRTQLRPSPKPMG